MDKKIKSFKQCQVCGTRENISSELKRSQLTMISFDVCKGCETTNAEPFDMLVAALGMDSNYNQLPEYQSLINDSLKRSNKSRTDLNSAIRTYID